MPLCRDEPVDGERLQPPIHPLGERDAYLRLREAIKGDVRQFDGTQRIARFADKEISAFMQETKEIGHAHEIAIRKTTTELYRCNKPNGEQVSRLIEKDPAKRSAPA